jgi:hypothetical protein
MSESTHHMDGTEHPDAAVFKIIQQKLIGLAEPEKKMVAALSSGCPPPPLALTIKACGKGKKG